MNLRMMAVVAWLGVSGSTWGCSCIAPGVREAVKQASIVGFWSDVGVELVVFAHQGVVTAAEPDTMRIPEWTDRVAVGTTIMSPAICSHSGEVKDSRETLRRLGKTKAQLKAQ